MDEDAIVYSQVYWEDVVYSENDDNAEQCIKSFGRTGYIMGVDRCSVTGLWHLLIAGHDGRFYTLTHDNPTLVYIHGEQSENSP